MPARSVRALIALFFITTIAGASFFVSQKLSTSNSVSPNAPDSKPQAAAKAPLSKEDREELALSKAQQQNNKPAQTQSTPKPKDERDDEPQTAKTSQAGSIAVAPGSAAQAQNLTAPTPFQTPYSGAGSATPAPTSTSVGRGDNWAEEERNATTNTPAPTPAKDTFGSTQTTAGQSYTSAENNQCDDGLGFVSGTGCINGKRKVVGGSEPAYLDWVQKNADRLATMTDKEILEKAGVSCDPTVKNCKTVIEEAQSKVLAQNIILDAKNIEQISNHRIQLQALKDITDPSSCNDTCLKNKYGSAKPEAILTELKIATDPDVLKQSVEVRKNFNISQEPIVYKTQIEQYLSAASDKQLAIDYCKNEPNKNYCINNFDRKDLLANITDPKPYIQIKQDEKNAAFFADPKNSLSDIAKEFCNKDKECLKYSTTYGITREFLATQIKDESLRKSAEANRIQQLFSLIVPVQTKQAISEIDVETKREVQGFNSEYQHAYWAYWKDKTVGKTTKEVDNDKLGEDFYKLFTSNPNEFNKYLSQYNSNPKSFTDLQTATAFKAATDVNSSIIALSNQAVKQVSIKGLANDGKAVVWANADDIYKVKAMIKSCQEGAGVLSANECKSITGIVNNIDNIVDPSKSDAGLIASLGTGLLAKKFAESKNPQLYLQKIFNDEVKTNLPSSFYSNTTAINNYTIPKEVREKAIQQAKNDIKNQIATQPSSNPRAIAGQQYQVQNLSTTDLLAGNSQQIKDLKLNTTKLVDQKLDNMLITETYTRGGGLTASLATAALATSLCAELGPGAAICGAIGGLAGAISTYIPIMGTVTAEEMAAEQQAIKDFKPVDILDNNIVNFIMSTNPIGIAEKKLLQKYGDKQIFNSDASSGIVQSLYSNQGAYCDTADGFSIGGSCTRKDNQYANYQSMLNTYGQFGANINNLNDQNFVGQLAIQGSLNQQFDALQRENQKQAVGNIVASAVIGYASGGIGGRLAEINAPLGNASYTQALLRQQAADWALWAPGSAIGVFQNAAQFDATSKYVDTEAEKLLAICIRNNGQEGCQSEKDQVTKETTEARKTTLLQGFLTDTAMQVGQSGFSFATQYAQIASQNPSSPRPVNPNDSTMISPELAQLLNAGDPRILNGSIGETDTITLQNIITTIAADTNANNNTNFLDTVADLSNQTKAPTADTSIVQAVVIYRDLPDVDFRAKLKEQGFSTADLEVAVKIRETNTDIPYTDSINEKIKQIDPIATELSNNPNDASENLSAKVNEEVNSEINDLKNKLAEKIVADAKNAIEAAKPKPDTTAELQKITGLSNDEISWLTEDQRRDLDGLLATINNAGADDEKRGAFTTVLKGQAENYAAGNYILSGKEAKEFIKSINGGDQNNGNTESPAQKPTVNKQEALASYLAKREELNLTTKGNDEFYTQLVKLQEEYSKYGLEFKEVLYGEIISDNINEYPTNVSKLEIAIQTLKNRFIGAKSDLTVSVVDSKLPTTNTSKSNSVTFEPGDNIYQAIPGDSNEIGKVPPSKRTSSSGVEEQVYYRVSYLENGKVTSTEIHPLTDTNTLPTDKPILLEFGLKDPNGNFQVIKPQPNEGTHTLAMNISNEYSFGTEKPVLVTTKPNNPTIPPTISKAQKNQYVEMFVYELDKFNNGKYANKGEFMDTFDSLINKYEALGLEFSTSTKNGLGNILPEGYSSLQIALIKLKNLFILPKDVDVPLNQIKSISISVEAENISKIIPSLNKSDAEKILKTGSGQRALQRINDNELIATEIDGGIRYSHRGKDTDQLDYFITPSVNSLDNQIFQYAKSIGIDPNDHSMREIIELIELIDAKIASKKQENSYYANGNDEYILKVAKGLGIDTTNKTPKQLRAELIERTNQIVYKQSSTKPLEETNEIIKGKVILTNTEGDVLSRKLYWVPDDLDDSELPTFFTNSEVDGVMLVSVDWQFKPAGTADATYNPFLEKTTIIGREPSVVEGYLIRNEEGRFLNELGHWTDPISGRPHVFTENEILRIETKISQLSNEQLSLVEAIYEKRINSTMALKQVIPLEEFLNANSKTPKKTSTERITSNVFIQNSEGQYLNRNFEWQDTPVSFPPREAEYVMASSRDWEVRPTKTTPTDQEVDVTRTIKQPEPKVSKLELGSQAPNTKELEAFEQAISYKQNTGATIPDSEVIRILRDNEFSQEEIDFAMSNLNSETGARILSIVNDIDMRIQNSLQGSFQQATDIDGFVSSDFLVSENNAIQKRTEMISTVIKNTNFESNPTTISIDSTGDPRQTTYEVSIGDKTKIIITKDGDGRYYVSNHTKNDLYYSYDSRNNSELNFLFALDKEGASVLDNLIIADESNNNVIEITVDKNGNININQDVVETSDPKIPQKYTVLKTEPSERLTSMPLTPPLTQLFPDLYPTAYTAAEIFGVPQNLLDQVNGRITNEQRALLIDSAQRFNNNNLIVETVNPDGSIVYTLTSDNAQKITISGNLPDTLLIQKAMSLGINPVGESLSSLSTTYRKTTHKNYSRPKTNFAEFWFGSGNQIIDIQDYTFFTESTINPNTPPPDSLLIPVTPPPSKNNGVKIKIIEVIKGFFGNGETPVVPQVNPIFKDINTGVKNYGNESLDYQIKQDFIRQIETLRQKLSDLVNEYRKTQNIPSPMPVETPANTNRIDFTKDLTADEIRQIVPDFEGDLTDEDVKTINFQLKNYTIGSGDREVYVVTNDYTGLATAKDLHPLLQKMLTAARNDGVGKASGYEQGNRFANIAEAYLNKKNTPPQSSNTPNKTNTPGIIKKLLSPVLEKIKKIKISETGGLRLNLGESISENNEMKAEFGGLLWMSKKSPKVPTTEEIWFGNATKNDPITFSVSKKDQILTSPMYYLAEKIGLGTRTSYGGWIPRKEYGNIKSVADINIYRKLSLESREFLETTATNLAETIKTKPYADDKELLYDIEQAVKTISAITGKNEIESAVLLSKSLSWEQGENPKIADNLKTLVELINCKENVCRHRELITESILQSLGYKTLYGSVQYEDPAQAKHAISAVLKNDELIGIIETANGTDIYQTIPEYAKIQGEQKNKKISSIEFESNPGELYNGVLWEKISHSFDSEFNLVFSSTDNFSIPKVSILNTETGRLEPADYSPIKISPLSETKKENGFKTNLDKEVFLIKYGFTQNLGEMTIKPSAESYNRWKSLGFTDEEIIVDFPKMVGLHNPKFYLEKGLKVPESYNYSDFIREFGTGPIIERLWVNGHTDLNNNIDQGIAILKEKGTPPKVIEFYTKIDKVKTTDKDSQNILISYPNDTQTKSRITIAKIIDTKNRSVDQIKINIENLKESSGLNNVLYTAKLQVTKFDAVMENSYQNTKKIVAKISDLPYINEADISFRTQKKYLTRSIDDLFEASDSLTFREKVKIFGPAIISGALISKISEYILVKLEILPEKDKDLAAYSWNLKTAKNEILRQLRLLPGQYWFIDESLLNVPHYYIPIDRLNEPKYISRPKPNKNNITLSPQYDPNNPPDLIPSARAIYAATKKCQDSFLSTNPNTQITGEKMSQCFCDQVSNSCTDERELQISNYLKDTYDKGGFGGQDAIRIFELAYGTGVTLSRNQLIGNGWIKYLDSNNNPIYMSCIKDEALTVGFLPGDIITTSSGDISVCENPISTPDPNNSETIIRSCTSIGADPVTKLLTKKIITSEEAWGIQRSYSYKDFGSCWQH